jgi:hypothetical protein
LRIPRRDQKETTSNDPLTFGWVVEALAPSTVIAGLDPAIHLLRKKRFFEE